MLNNTGIKKETYGSGNQILFAVEHQVSMGIVVDKSVGITEGTKKIAKAGTPITGNLDARETAFTAAVSSGDTNKTSNAVGILLHDVDVTVGDNNGTILLFGFVNTNRIDDKTKAKITAEVKAALPMIKFVAC
jgi:DNA helicase TIP49 (TBP-interacting protein)